MVKVDSVILMDVDTSNGPFFVDRRVYSVIGHLASELVNITIALKVSVPTDGSGSPTNVV